MARVSKVYLDMDGVLADFISRAAQLHSRSFKDLWVNSPKNRGKFWIDEAWGLTREEFWSPIINDQEFWSELDIYPKARELVDTLNKYVGEGNLYLLTAPAPYPGCYAGKMEWILTNFPELKNKLILTKHKGLLAKPDTLLVDDADHNFESFIKAGGRAVLLPRPWNSEHKKLDVFDGSHPNDDKPYELLNKKLRKILWQKKERN